MPEEKLILLVEDDQFIRELSYKALSDDKELKNTVKIETAETGDKAIEKLDQFGTKINLVLLDIIVPGKDGYEILEYMGKSENLKNIPVVVLSNLGQDEEIDKAKELGAKDFMIKAQTDIDEIVAKAKEYL